MKTSKRVRKFVSAIEFLPWRFYFLGLIIFSIILALIIRVFMLSVFEHSFLVKQGNSRSLRVVQDPSYRGMILDRQGYPFAVSALVYSLWFNPQTFIPNKKAITSLAKILSIHPSVITKKLQNNKSKEFVYLKRKISPLLANQVAALKLPGLFLQQDFKRFYPDGEVAAQIIGFTNLDDKGQEGLELSYDQWLSGNPGKKLITKDRLGRVVNQVQTLQAERKGQDLRISLDHRIQFLAYRELMRGVKKNQADSGSVVVLDVKTGEILAMVNHPSFNPNNIATSKRDYIRNRAVTDIFEPGSTMKAFSVASALDSGKFNSESLIDTYPGWTRVGKHLVRDEHQNGLLTLKQILQLSSNVGVTKIVLALPPQQIWSLFQRVGFGEITGIGFPGEQSGRLIRPMVWDPFMISTLSFGYGVSVTALQLAHAYAILANDGVKIPVSLLPVDAIPKGEQVINPRVSKQMLQLLESVVSKAGTGKAASVPGYRVAGKTGTAIVAGLGGYKKRNYVSSFVGIAPVTNPRLVVAVVLHNPKGKQYYGGLVSGPIFEKIMEGSLRDLNIPPDAQGAQ